jgi:DNA-binding transcriptional ArsR family regulator
VDRKVLLSAVGFRPAMILPLVDVLRPDHVVLVAGKHGEVTKAEVEVLRELKGRSTSSEIHHVDDWDVQAWSDLIAKLLEQYKDDQVVVNLTAGHGLSTAMLGIHATQRSLPVACYDWETFAKTGEHPRDLEKFIHFHSPAAVFNLNSTQPIDRQILGSLLQGPQGVGALSKRLGVPQSSISTSLARLIDRGFLDRESMGRERIYRLRAGLEPLVSKGLGFPLART